MTDTLARALASADDHTIDRRKLLKVGAWAAPVVVLAAAVPAAGASGTAALSFAPGANLFYTWGSTAVSGIGGTVAVKLDHTSGSGGSATPVTVVISVDAAGLAAGVPAQVVSGSGWATAGVAGPTNGRMSYTFTYAPALAAGASTATLVFSVAAATGFAPIFNRAWTMPSTGTGVNATLSGASAVGTVSVAAVGATAAVAVPAEPDVPVGKDVTITVEASSSAVVVPRLSVKRTHQNDGFATPVLAEWGITVQGTGKTATDIATGTGFTGRQTITFPKYSQQTGSDSHTWTIEFLVNGVPFAPATKTGTL